MFPFHTLYSITLYHAPKFQVTTPRNPTWSKINVSACPDVSPCNNSCTASGA